MDNLDTSDVLLNRGLNGAYGYGRQGREFASDASNAVRIGASERIASNQHAAISQQISDNADRNRDLLNFGQATTAGTALNDKITDQTRFFSSEINLITRELAEHAREAAKCCCETKLLASQNQAKTDAGLATIVANQECATKVADAIANASQNAKLDVLLNERGRHHGGNG